MLTRLSGEQALLITSFVAGIGWVASKYVLTGMPPAEFIGLRFLLAGLILLCLCYRSIMRLPKKLIAQAFGVGLLFGSGLLLWIVGLNHSKNMGEGAFIMCTAVLFSPLVSWLIYKQAPSKAFWRALPIALSGMATLSLTNGFSVSLDQIYFFAAALIFASYLSVNKAVAAHIKPLTLVCIQLFAVAALAFAIHFIHVLLGNTDSELNMTAVTWGWFLTGVILATSLRYVLQTHGQANCPPATAAILLLLEPVWALVMSMLFFAETLTLQKAIGCSLIIAAQLFYRQQEARALRTAKP